ncbi:MAG: DUF2970 domain-containing protein [Gammaproteobacteria bacterium]
MTDQQHDKDSSKPSQVSTLDVVISVFRAWFGVQTEENRKRDFNSNDPTPFIVAGIIFTLIMIVGVIIAVKFALSGT